MIITFYLTHINNYVYAVYNVVKYIVRKYKQFTKYK